MARQERGDEVSARDEIFASIRRSLHVTGAEEPRRLAVRSRLEQHPSGVIPARGQGELPEQITTFRAEAERAGATVAVVASPNAAMGYKFVFDPPTNDYEGVTTINQDGGGNRFFDNYTQVLPVVYFSDAPFAPTAQVTFNVDMSVVALTDTNFNPASVTLNGDLTG